MRSYVYLSTVVLVLSAAVLSGGPLLAQEDAKAQIISIEETLWKAWKNQDTQPFEMHLSDDTVNINAGGITSGKAQVIQSVAGGTCDVKSYSLSDWKVHQLTEDTAILTYRAQQSGTCDGEPIPAAVYASSVYLKKGGKWLAASYHETPVAK